MTPVRMLHRSCIRVSELSTGQLPVVRHRTVLHRAQGVQEHARSFQVGVARQRIRRVVQLDVRLLRNHNTKGLSKCHNEIDKDAFLDVPTNRRSSSRTNRGYHVNHSSVLTYVHAQAPLTYFYTKHVMLEDWLSIAPVEV